MMSKDTTKIRLIDDCQHCHKLRDDPQTGKHDIFYYRNGLRLCSFCTAVFDSNIERIRQRELERQQRGFQCPHCGEWITIR